MESIAHRIQELASLLKIEEDPSFFIDFEITEGNEKVLELYDSEFMEFPNRNGDFSFLAKFNEIDAIRFDIDQEIYLHSLNDCYFLERITIDTAVVRVDASISLPNLKMLRFENNSYIKTESLNFLAQIPNLEALQYNFNLNTVRDIDVVAQLQKLTMLAFINGTFSSIDSISKLTQLQQLQLYNCKNITDFSALQNLKKLTHLTLHACNFNDTSVLSNFKNLESLSIIATEIEEIHELRSLSKLKVLNLIQNKFKNIDEIVAIPELLNLNVSKNEITEIPKLKDSKIVYADFSNNSITSIENLVENDHMQNLNIANNQVKNIARLPKNLVHLYANDNPIEALHARDCHKLSSIHCENHSIKEPENLSINGDTLQYINLKHKNLSSLFAEEYYKSGPPEKKFYHLFKKLGDQLFKKRLFEQAYKSYEKSIHLKTILACRKIEQELQEQTAPSFGAISYWIDIFMKIKKENDRTYDLVGNKKMLDHISDFIVFKIKNAKISEAEQKELYYKLLYKVYPTPSVKTESLKSHSKTNLREKSKNDRFIKNVARFFWMIGIVTFLIMLFTLIKVFLFR
ncbi:MAG: hypothetical protein AAF611_04625 [Bacteroidota bacterium]